MAEAILAPNSSWFAPNDTTITRVSITEIDIVDSYTPTGNETDSWDASEAKDGSVMCYVTGTKLTLAGNGSGCIYANIDASYTFADVNETDYFFSVTAIAGLNILDVSRVTTMCSMFRKCTSLTSLAEIGGWNTGLVEDMDHMFAGNSYVGDMALAEIDVRNWDVSNVKYMGHMFYGCAQLTELDLGKWNTSKLFDLNHAFADCFGLTSLNVADWDVSNCHIFNATFNDCHGLTALDLSGWVTANGRTFNQMFEMCSSLTKISGLENFNTSKVSTSFIHPVTGEEVNAGGTFNEMFSGCYVLTELDLSSFDTKTVPGTEKMFGSCHKLKTIYVSDLWDMQSVTTSEKMFNLCRSLVGEDGTAFSADHIDVTYARVDSGADAPGYFTHIQNVDDEVLVQSKSLYRIGKSIRKALNSIDKYKPSEMAGVIGGFSPNAVKGTFTPEEDTAVFSVDDLPFKPCCFVIGSAVLHSTAVNTAIFSTNHINGVTGAVYYYSASGKKSAGTLDQTDPVATNYADNSLIIDYTGWGMYFKAGYTYDYIISGGFDE